jgi:hypothetical protein
MVALFTVVGNDQLTLHDAKHGQSEQRTSDFFPKYLTSPVLFPLEVRKYLITNSDFILIIEYQSLFFFLLVEQ